VSLPVIHPSWEEFVPVNGLEDHWLELIMISEERSRARSRIPDLPIRPENRSLTGWIITMSSVRRNSSQMKGFE
jgi:hypothetical protein